MLPNINFFDNVFSYKMHPQLLSSFNFSLLMFISFSFDFSINYILCMNYESESLSLIPCFVSVLLVQPSKLKISDQCAEFRKLCSICNYETELKKLLDTVEIIKKCLLDADSKCQELTNEGQYWVENLKDAVYDADDMLDEFNTIAHQLKGMPGGKIFKKVRRFFSSNNQLMFAFDKSNEIKKLREKLDSLAKNRRDFGFSELYKPVKIREETCSYVYEESIIGRDADKETIVDLLLKDDSEKNISFVTIVGIGGLGKTALAQLVFRDHRIKEAFKDEMYWVCVSLDFDTKDILGKMIGMNELGFEDLHKIVRNKIEGKRFLLVLDDVWYENGRKWDELKNFLILGGRGSRILVTSRSRKVAGAIGNYPIHELPGLSVENSWVLFKKISLGQREDEAVTDFVEIGREIVKKCVNVPLSIRVVASLLRNQDIATWQSFKSNDLASMCVGEDGIMPTLMFSYYHLAPGIKSCFSFCSLFHEDCYIEKTELIRLWMAQGYLVPSAKYESMEDVGEKYVSILLHRCFFQDIIKGPFDEVKSFKMHDLMHELARKVAAKECLTLTACTNDLEGKARHLLVDSNEGLITWFHSSNYPTKTLRTYFTYSVCLATDVDAIISNCCRLRVLDLRNSLTIGNLPDRIGKLLHLRYLDLSHNNELVMLPESITKLHNLQTFKLVDCEKLKELPGHTSKLVNLRVLDVFGCESLTHMPAGMGKLTYLHTLRRFIVGGDDKKGKLMDLIALISNNLRGYLYVGHNVNSNYVPIKAFSHNRMLVKLQPLKLWVEIDAHREGQEMLLESLFFAVQFQEMSVENYGGTKLPSWAAGLVRIDLKKCDELQYLPSSLSQLCHLRYLNLDRLRNLEYIDSDTPSPSAKFFPSLEKLELIWMTALKGWWRDIRWMEKEAVFIPSFPRLSELEIEECERLTYILSCPLVKKLKLNGVNEALPFCMKGGVVQSNPFSLESLSIDNSCVFNSRFREFVGSAVSIKLMGIENLGTIREGLHSFSSVKYLEIWYCRGLENLEIEHLNLKSLTLGIYIEGMPWKSLHTLSFLEITCCQQVIILPKEIQYLTSLDSLFLYDCGNLEDLGECFNSLTSLKLLKFNRCYKLKSLPEEMRHLTSLATLEIEYCSLKSLPEAMRHLTSLTTLKIRLSGPQLKDRCQKSVGEDWPKICHIPNLDIL